MERDIKGVQKKIVPFSKFESGLLTRTVCPRRLSFSQFNVLMSTPNCLPGYEKTASTASAACRKWRSNQDLAENFRRAFADNFRFFETLMSGRALDQGAQVPLQVSVGEEEPGWSGAQVKEH